jgi:hypothetical protein
MRNNPQFRQYFTTRTPKAVPRFFSKPESLDGILYWHSVGVFAILWHILYLPNAFIAKANIDRGVGTREI